MRISQRHQRRNQHRHGPSISLFPFLAVLICTMGALVPLLLAITRTARLQAEAAVLAKAAEQGGQLQTRREDVRWRIGQLKQSRVQTESQLADARLVLGHLEDHSRRLRNKLAQFERTVADVDRLENADRRQRGQAQAELEQVRGQIEAAQRQLAETRQAAAGHSRSYAVVPYEGPNQTHRRPIYLECRADAVVLQPEGIELTESDFEGPLGSGNPLAAALRAAREHLSAARDFDPQAGEPYPMLLVRPEGINAYYAARAAMKSWGHDFGYELIDDDWKLAYPPPDPRLADVVRQAVASARVSQARLAAAAPRHYASRPKVTYRASPGHGGFIREQVADDDDRGYRRVTPAGPVGHNEQPMGSGRGVGGGMPGGGNQGDNAETGGDVMAANPYLPATERTGTTGSGAGTSGYPNYVPAASSTGVSASAGSPATGPQLGVGEGNSAEAHGSQPVGVGTAANGAAVLQTHNPVRDGDRERAERPEGYIVGQPPREHQSSNRPQPSAAAGRGQALRPGDWEPTPDPPPQRHDDKNKPNKSLAEKRGVDWGLRDAARGSVGITRPISVECRADRLVIVSERGPSHDKAILLGPRVESSIDTFISAVWEQMESWGMAGRGMYWRPVLQVRVAPDAEQRFAELSALLEASGLTLERK